MSAIDELFSGVAEEQKSGSEIVREQVGNISDNTIACAEKQFTHLFAFVINAPFDSSKSGVVENIANSLEYVFENLKAIIDVHSTVKPNFSLAYSKSAAKILKKEQEDESKSEYYNLNVQILNKYIDKLLNTYDLVECPDEIVLKINKEKENWYANPSEYFKQFYIICKCSVRNNMLNTNRLFTNIYRAVQKENKNLFKTIVLYNDNGVWKNTTTSFININNIEEISKAWVYTKDLEDKFIWLYKDLFYHDKKKTTAENVEFNRRLIFDFKKMINKRTSWKLKREQAIMSSRS